MKDAKMRKFLLGSAIATMLLLPSCVILFPMRTALSWDWTRPGATPEDLHAAKHACVKDWVGVPAYKVCMEASGWTRN